MDTTKAITHVSLCAGYGGIDLGLHRAIRNLRTIAVSEIEAFACANLVAKMEAGLLDPAPIWTDLKTFPWAEFRDRVDILSGGYPCQPFSAAGKRLGAEDPRHLWPHISAGIAAMRPSVCFFENVEGHISLGLPDVIEDLGRLGYRTTWGIFSASEVGAPHQRKRVFILAYRQHQRSPLAGIVTQLRPAGVVNGSREELALTSSLGSAAGIPRPQQGHERIAGVADYCGDQAWPSRPGEQQFAWEPPRVVVDAKSQRANRRLDVCDEECGSRQSLQSELNDTGREDATMGQPSSQRCKQAERAVRSEQQPSGIGEECGLGVAEAVGNATQRQDHGREPGDLGTAPSQGRCGDYATDGAGEAVGNAEELRRARLRQDAAANLDEQLIEPANASQHGGLDNADGIGWQESGHQQGSAPQSPSRRQTQPPLGRDADGPADWLDDAELFTTCDNRTDELRLLGNGVVPATAERAFRVLVGELMEHQT